VTCTLCGTPFREMADFCVNCGGSATASRTATVEDGVRPTSPPNGVPIHEEMLKEQVAARAKQAANMAAATGSVAKGAFLSTLKGANTLGEKAVVFGSLAGIVAFFLPWAAVLGTMAVSGWSLAVHGSAWAWLYPISMVAVFVMSWFLLKSDARKRILAARWFLVIGTLWCAPGLVLVSNILSGAAGIGMYLGTVAAGAILVGGLLQISDSTKKLSFAPAAVS
jgi:hypothetical protein